MGTTAKGQCPQATRQLAPIFLAETLRGQQLSPKPGSCSVTYGWMAPTPSTGLSSSCCPTSSSPPGTMKLHPPGSSSILSLSLPPLTGPYTHNPLDAWPPGASPGRFLVIFFYYFSSTSFVPDTVLSALCLLAHLIPHSTSPNEYYYTNLANEEAEPQKQGHPMHCTVAV